MSAAVPDQSLSIVVPVRNEAPNLPLLWAEIVEVLDRLGRPAEVVFVDDGSTDGSPEIVRGLMAADPRVRLVRLRAHAGLTAAFDAGFRAARGQVIVTLDADLQNDPRDIPALLALLEGADAVTGWRRERRDPWLKRVSSRVANGIRNRVTGAAIHDSACSLRAIRRHCLDGLVLVNGLHRFLPTLLAMAGHRVVEIPVNHRPRRFGRSSFGVRNRALRGLVDLLAVRWLMARRLDYTATEDDGPPAPPPAPRRRRATPAAHLVLVWAALATLLAAWLWTARPGGIEHLVRADDSIALALASPAPLVSTWVLWQAPPGESGWIVLEPPGRWAPGAEPFWRRRVHPGWNHLTWSEARALPDGVARLRVLQGRPSAWGATPLESGAGYGPAHLAALSGLLSAAAIGLFLAARRLRARTAVWTRSAAPMRPGGWGLALGAVTAGALALRMHTLSGQSLWFDEVLTAIGSQDLAWVLYTPQIFGHPPVQYLAGWLAGGRGVDDGWLRAPFALAGVATVPVVAWLGRRLLGRAAGLLAALTLALSPFHIELSQTARPYAVFLLFAALALLALVSAIARDRADRWMLFTAAMTLTLYTHYNGGSLLLLAGLTAGLLLAGRPGRTWAAAGVSFAAVVLLLLPWWPVLARLAAAQVGQGDLPAAALQQLVVSVFVPQFLGPGWAMVTGLALIARGLASLRRDRRLPVMLVWLALPIALIWAAQPGHFVAGRHLSFLLLPLLLLLGQGLVAAGADAARLAGAVRGTPAWLPRATTVAAALLLLVAWASPTVHALGDYYASRQGFDWRVVADVLDAAVPEGEPILATAGAGYPLRHYWRAGIEVLEPATFRPQLEARRASRGAWIVTHEGWDRPAGLTEWLGSHAVLVAEVPPSWSLPGVRVWRTRSPDGASPAASGTVAAGRARPAPGPSASPPPR